MKIIKQQDEQDCGVACLSMILNSYKTSIPLQKLRTISGTDIEGTTAYGLKKGAEYYGLNCKVIKATPDFFHTNSQIKLPIIAHIITKQSLQHYLVIYKIKNSTLYIADPARGKIKQNITDFIKEWTGVLFLFSPSSKYKPITEKETKLKDFIPLLSHNKGKFSIIILVSILITIFGIIGAYYFQFIIDTLIPKNKLNILDLTIISIVIMYLFNSIFTFIKNQLLVIVGQKMSASLMMKYIDHILSLPMTFFSNRKTGDIVSRFQDANKIIDGLINTVLSIFLDLSMLILVGATLIFQSHQLFMITLISIPLYLIIVYAFKAAYDKNNHESMQATADVDSNIIQSIHGIETIKSFSAETLFTNKINKQFKILLEKSKKLAWVKNSQEAIKVGINLIINSIVIGIGAFLVINHQLSIGQLMAYDALAAFFTNPLQNIINLQPTLQTANVANKRLSEIFQIQPEKLTCGTFDNKDFTGNININNLSFSYGLKAPTLKNISFKVQAGQKIALVGASGSGKSTLLKLLVKFYPINTGNITYENKSIMNLNITNLRNNVTYVPQESFFFRGTLLENILFGIDKESIDPKNFKQLAHDLQLNDFINRQPLKWNMYIEEDGSNLSGGQKQKFALFRALLKNSPILLLDEATSNLDPISENLIISKLLNLHNKTIIFIVHHLPIAKKCDKILVMDNGKIVQQGTHAELLHQKGIYKRLYTI